MNANEPVAHAAPPQHANHGKDRSAPRILLFEDQSHVRACVMLSLKSRNLEAVAVGNGADGLKAFDASRFDLAIVDIFMLGMDGIAVIKELRARRPTLPVIAISGVHLDSAGGTAFDLIPKGAGTPEIVFLMKPFQTEQLIQAVHRAMGAAAPG